MRKHLAPLGRWAENYPLNAFFALLPLFFLYVFAAIKLYGAIDGYRPQFDLVLDIEVPLAAGAIEVYLNGDYANPHRAMIKPPGKTVYVFRNVPQVITHIRIDPSHRPDIDIKMNAIRFITGPNYRAAPGVEVFSFDTADWTGWSSENMERRPDSSSFRSTTNDPMLHAFPNLDLLSRLPEPPRIPSILYLAAGLAIIVGAALVAASIKVALVINARWPRAKDYAVPVALAVFGWSVTVLSSFPAHTNFDEYYSLNEALAGVISDIHPPLQAVVWVFLIDLSEALGLEKIIQLASMLLVQTTLFWSIACVLAFAFRSRVLGALFLLSLALLPPTLSYLGHIGKDTQMGIAFFIAVAVLYLAARYRSYTFLFVSLLPIFYGLSVRSNGPAAALPFCFLWVVMFLEISGIGLKTIVRKGTWILASLALFTVLIGGNKAFYDAVVDRKCCLGNAGLVTPTYDLMGISYRIGKNLVPPYLYSDPSYSLETVKQKYNTQYVIFEGLSVIGPEHHRRILLDWMAAVKTYPLAYLGHRWAVLREFFGYTNQPNPFPLFLGFYRSADLRLFNVVDRTRDVFKGIDAVENDLFEIKSAFVHYFVFFKDSLLFRPWFYIVLFTTSFLFLGGRGERLLSRLSLYVGLSGALYFLPYIPLTSAAQFRYVWWSLLATVMVIFFRLDETLQTRPTPASQDRARPLLRERARRAIPARLIASDGYFKVARLHPDLSLFVGSSVLFVLLGYAGLWFLS